MCELAVEKLKGGDRTSVASWKDGLSPDQIDAAGHIGSSARLLAGPGTGKTKTLTHRALALVIEHSSPPDEILVLTFTRAAAHQLRSELGKALGPLSKGTPRVSTLHSFALKQLLINSGRVEMLPKPLRIADDWEERNIIQEDLKVELKKPIKDIKELFEKLSADWETLRIEQDQNLWMCSDPNFIGMWKEHRKIFGYTLRSELVYQLKRALNQYPDFKLESGFKHLLVDEYQDLNACDLAVIEELSNRGFELFVAGDDDQSIYGFRYASPIGIRVFADKYKAKSFTLETCYRCDKNILDIGEFVANLDYQRLPKRTKAKDNSPSGEVHLRCYKDQLDEAQGIAEQCKAIFCKDENSSILLLIRSDDKRVISDVLIDALKKTGVPVAVQTEESLLDSKEGRVVTAFLRLLDNQHDSLAWQTLLILDTKGVGVETFRTIRELSKERSITFAQALMAIVNDPKCLRLHGDKVAGQVEKIHKQLSGFSTEGKLTEALISEVLTTLISDEETRSKIGEFFKVLIKESEAETLSDLLRAVAASLDVAEQEVKIGAVNVMTMHKAKGLTADAVFIAGAEKQFIPGKNIGLKAEDERRLLYVSLTRAKHYLDVSYCLRRTGRQRHTGSSSGNPNRSLTPFLEDSPLKVQFMK